MRFHRCFHFEVSAIRLEDGKVVGRNLESRKSPLKLRNGQNFVGQAMQASGRERSFHERTTRAPELYDAGDVHQGTAPGSFELAPKDEGAASKGDIRGMLEIADAKDPGRSMRGATVMTVCESLDPQHPQAAPGKMQERGASGSAETAHDHIEFGHSRIIYPEPGPRHPRCGVGCGEGSRTGVFAIKPQMCARSAA